MHAAIQVVIGMLAADVAAATVHWLEDTYLPYCTPSSVLGAVARENELHHYYPRDIVRKPAWRTCFATLMLSTLLVAVVGVVSPAHVWRHRWLYAAFVVTGTLSNLVHKWAHMRDCELGPVVLWLQRAGVLCGHGYHARHHQQPDRFYGVVFPAVDRVLDAARVFRGLEAAVLAATGVPTSRKPPYSVYTGEMGLVTDVHRATEASPCPPVVSAAESARLGARLAAHYACQAAA